MIWMVKKEESDWAPGNTTMIASSTGKDQKQKHAIQQNKHHRRISTILTIVLKWFWHGPSATCHQFLLKVDSQKLQSQTKNLPQDTPNDNYKKGWEWTKKKVFDQYGSWSNRVVIVAESARSWFRKKDRQSASYDGLAKCNAIGRIASLFLYGALAGRTNGNRGF